MTERTMTISLI